MKLFNLIKKFRSDESGAVTVDWVVLTAAIVGLGIVVMTTVGGGIEELAGQIAADVGETKIGYQPSGGSGGANN
jgi:Flp pilus assembly pilin Flp